MNPMPNTVEEIKVYFNKHLHPQFDKEEIKNFCLLTLEKFLGISRAELRLRSEMKIQEDVAKKFVTVVDELLTHKPIQYILGETEFYGFKFIVDENVLIPRQETEELVDWILTQYRVQSTKYKDLEIQNSEFRIQNFNLLDIGTGSGCIAVSLKKNLAGSNVSAMDVSEEALKLAAKNARLNDVEVNFILQNILDKYSPVDSERAGVRYDIIVSNPPYILQSESKLMQKNVLEYEPHLALFVEDEDPLLFYSAIATFAKMYLKEKGQLYFEINEAQGNQVALLLYDNGFENVQVKKDLNGKDRMVRAINA